MSPSSRPIFRIIEWQTKRGMLTRHVYHNKRGIDGGADAQGNAFGGTNFVVNLREKQEFSPPTGVVFQEYFPFAKGCIVSLSYELHNKRFATAEHSCCTDHYLSSATRVLTVNHHVQENSPIKVDTISVQMEKCLFRISSQYFGIHIIGYILSSSFYGW